MPYQRDEEFEARKQSIRRLLQAVLSCEGVAEDHLKKVVNLCLWQLTEAESKDKYNLQYASEAAHQLLETNVEHGSPERVQVRRQLRHEHVFTRKELVDRVLACPSRAWKIIRHSIGCVVTKDEHSDLSRFSNYHGWERYREAKIKVWDRSTNQPADLDELIATSPRSPKARR